MNKKYEEENVILLKIKKEKEYFEKSYHIILNSNSWKITKPIRLILDKIKESSSVNLIKRFLNHLKKYGFMFTFYKVKDYLRRDKACIIKDNNNFMEVITFNGMINYIDNYSEEKESLIYGKEQILEYDNYNINKNIILVSHALDLTGAPSAIVFFAEKLKRDGYNVIVVSPISGRLIDLLYEKGIPVIVYKELFRDNFIQRYCSLFSLVIANTIVSSPIISQLSMSKIRVLWWIHEADTSYHEGQIKSIPQNIGSNVKIYCGGSYAANVFKKYFPQHSTEILLYYIPEITDLFNSDNYKLNYCNTREKIVFVTIGTQEERKGQDILVDAILTLEYEVLKNCYFIFVGKEFYIPIAEKIRFISKKYPNNIKYIPEMNPRDLKTLYYTMDCLICPSKDDPMPIVVTEAFIMKKAVICSENIGQSEYIVDGFNGLLYHNNSCIELSEKIRYFVDNKDRLSRLGVEARKIYDKYFSESAFDNSISRIMNEMNSNLSTPLNISIIIPTYNAGHQFEKMVELLKNQKIDGNIEIIVVDSGSKDITREICVSKEITLIEISNSDFSHSFARNLGAEKSNGDILVFMTQDALPSSHDWLKKLVEPIVSEEITAVSCAESCPEGTDLYYRICSFNHSKYVGFFDKDVVGSISKCNDVDSLRKNSSLNDVSCAIRKDIFMKYRYRFDYAEDLDLGVRLIKDGYKIKILSNLYTIHGHNRNSDYYLKRSLVESKTFPKIFEAVESHENEEIVSSRIVYSYFLVINSILESEKQNITFESTIDFIKKFSFILDNKIRNTKYIKDFKIDSIFNNNEIYNIVSILKQRYNVKFNDSSPYIAMGVRGYLDIVVDYLTLNPVQYSNEIKNSIYDCCIKQLSVITGSELLKLQNDEMILSYINILSKGV